MSITATSVRHSGRQQIALVLPAFCAKTAWVGAPTVVAEFAVSLVDYPQCAIQHAAAFASSAYTLAIRDATGRKLLAAADGLSYPLYQGERVASAFVIEVWSTAATGTQLTFPERNLPLVAKPSGMDKPLTVTATLNDALWCQFITVADPDDSAESPQFAISYECP